jgi:hypothetical protein
MRPGAAGSILVACAVLAWLAAALPARSQAGITIYRCTDASGALTIQNDTPCPPGQRQTVQHIDPPPPLPSYTTREQRMPEIVANERARREAAIAEAVPPPVSEEERTAPPPLFQCTTWDKDTYISADETPAERCAPLQLVGLDGRSMPGMDGLAGACEKRVDTCQAVPEEALCSSWRRRVDEAEFRWKFAGAAEHDPRRLEFEQWAAILRNSTCE